MSRPSAASNRRQLRDQLDWSLQFLKKFEHLNAKQLNWHPSQKEWSVGQCFDHMRLGMAPYLPVIREKIAEAHRSGGKEGTNYSSSFWGRLMIKAVAPDSKLPVPVPPPMVPTNDPLGPEILRKFRAQLDEIGDLLRRSEGIDLSKARMKSPFAKWLTFPIGDALMILVVHNRRHMLQAERVMNRPQFPQH